MREVHVVSGESGLIPPAVAGVDLASLVTRAVQRGVVLGRVPRLVRVPGVDVEEELFLVVSLQPLLGLRDGARHEPVRLRPPRLSVVGALVRPRVVALAPDPDEVVEAAVVPEPAPDEERRVHNAHRQVTGFGEKPRKRGQAMGQRLPAHVGVGEGARQDVRPGRHGGEGGDHVPVEDDRGARELV